MPAHWGVERSKRLFNKMSRPVRDGDDVVTCFRDGTVTLRKNRRVRGFTESLKEIGYQGIRRGDLVIHAMDAFAGAIGVSDSDGKGTPVYAVCAARAGSNPHFYAHIIREMSRSGWITALARGIRERSTDFRYETFADQFVPTPPSEEQAAIVRFLDHAEWRIRKYIAAKRKFIALLNEQKQAIIYRVVTRGLDPTVRLKTSGIDWLGDIPAHWDVRPLKRLSGRISGRLVFKPSQYFTESGVPFIMGNNVSTQGISLVRTKFVSEETNNRFAHHALHEGDVVTVRVGAPGVTAVVPKEADGLNCGSLMIIRRSPKFCSQWLAYCLNSHLGKMQIALVQYGAAQEQINITDAVNFVLPAPPVPEQRMIADALGERIEPLDRLVAAERRAIALAQDYRVALVAQVVTGKLDVRGVSTPAGDEALLMADDALSEQDSDDDEMLNEPETEAAVA